MIFSELYGAYYKTVAEILKAAVTHPIDKSEMYKIIKENAFDESSLIIEPALTQQRWQLLNTDGSTNIKNAPTMPMTLLEKRWLKSIFFDPRIKLFCSDIPDFSGVEPLFAARDICVFDKYSDGDDFSDENYIKHFGKILDSVKNKYPIEFVIKNRKGKNMRFSAQPMFLEYSEKDDKFRVIVSGCPYADTVNLSRIISCERAEKAVLSQNRIKENDTVVLEVADERNALERVLMHFAHFAKEAEKIGEGRYRVSVEYDRDDETEVLIRILSFGPFVKVVSPKRFEDMIKKRLKMQKSCGQK